MTRITSLASNNQLVNQLLRLQSRIHNAQIQISSEKRSQDYTGLAYQSERLVGIETTRNLLNRFTQNNELMDLRLNITNESVKTIDKTISTFREALLTFNSGSKTDETLVDTVQRAALRGLMDMEVYLNTEFNGEFVYSGSRVNTSPVDFGLTTLTALQTKWNGDTISYPTYATNHIYPKLTATTGSPTNPTGAGFTNLSFLAGPPGTVTSAVAGGFANIPVGAQITIANATDAANNSTFTVDANDGTTITLPAGVSFALRAGDVGTGTGIAMTTDISYYSGDEIDQSHHASKNRSFSLDMNGLDPAFEKAIRAMFLIAQGDFGATGGLDQNTGRVDDATYLLNSSLEANPSGTPPFGTELASNMDQLSIDLGYDRALMESVVKTNKNLVGYFESEIADIENIDPLNIVSKLLDDQRALETSYQAMARIRQLSLANYL